MKTMALLASMASLAVLAAASAASAATIDGVISPGEYTSPPYTITNTPYSPGADTTLTTFGAGNELAAQTIYFGADPNGLGMDIAIQVDPAGEGLDNADASLGLQFANLYFGDPDQGAYLGFEVGNNNAFVPATGVNTSSAGLGILYSDTPGTTYAAGGTGSVAEIYIPYSAYESLASTLGQTVEDSIQLRDVQAFSYAGNNGNPAGSRFGSVKIPTAVAGAPEPSSWALMLLGVGGAGFMLRRNRRSSAATPATA